MMDPRIVVVRQMIWEGKITVSGFSQYDPAGRETAARWLIEQLDNALKQKATELVD